MTAHDERTRPTQSAEPAVIRPVDGIGTRDYLRLGWQRVKGGETGVLPVVGGLVLVSIVFQSLNSHFLTAGNLVNLLVQAAVFALFGMAEVFERDRPVTRRPRGGGLGQVAEHGDRPERAPAGHRPALHRREVLGLVDHDVHVGRDAVDQRGQFVEQHRVRRRPAHPAG